MLSEPKVLIIEADPELGRELQAVLKFINCTPSLADSPERWKDDIGNASEIQAVLVGSCGSDKMLSSVLTEIHTLDEHLPVYLLAEKGKEPTVTIDTGSCILGRLDVPPNYAQLTSALHQAEVYTNSHRATSVTQRPVDLFRSLVGSSRSIQKVRKMIDQVAGSDANVLVLGESGTGKEVVARNLHYHSSRREGPFVPVNCGAIPGDLLESELFGHKKGAFTGATSDRAGKFESANGGTIFLDEVGELPLQGQVKLLRVLQSNEIQRVGSDSVQEIDTRIVAATNRNLLQMSQEGHFREDLFYRLSVVQITLPPLRERLDEIPLLVDYFAGEAAEKLEREPIRLSPRLRTFLNKYNYPGNIRELRNLIFRISCLADETGDLRHLPEHVRPQHASSKTVAGPVSSEQSLGEVRQAASDAAEKAYLEDVLSRHAGNVTKSANAMEVNRSHLQTLLKKHGLSSKSFKSDAKKSSA